MRVVGEESSKTYEEKIKNGFFTKYMSGYGAEIGYAGYKEGVVPILENCVGYDLTTPGYDGKIIPVSSNTYDYVYSSHCLEHIENPVRAIIEWFRVIKPKGYLVIVVPHRDLYEKKFTLPSRFNEDHKAFYTPAKLLQYIEESLLPNTYRIRHLRDNDEGHDYADAPEIHGKWLYEIELVLEKL